EVFHDDARVVQHQVAIDERRRGVVRIQVEQILGILARVDVDDLDVDRLLGDHDARAMAPGIVRRRKQRHRGTSVRHSVPSSGAAARGAGSTPAQRTSFQYSFFSSNAMPVNIRRNRITQIPRPSRCSCVGSPAYARKLTVSRTNSSYCAGVTLPATPGSNFSNSRVTSDWPPSPLVSTLRHTALCTPCRLASTCGIAVPGNCRLFTPVWRLAGSA